MICGNPRKAYYTTLFWQSIGYIIWQHGLKYSLSGWATQNYKRIQVSNWYSGIESKNSISFWCSNLLFSDPPLLRFLATYQITEAFIFNKKRRKCTKSRNKVPNGYFIKTVIETGCNVIILIWQVVHCGTSTTFLIYFFIYGYGTKYVRIQ